MPGPQSHLKTPVGVKILFAVRGEGSRIRDVGGNDYIDYMRGAGPGIVGYGDRDYLQALKENLDTLYYLVSGAPQAPMEIDVAETLQRADRAMTRL